MMEKQPLMSEKPLINLENKEILNDILKRTVCIKEEAKYQYFNCLPDDGSLAEAEVSARWIIREAEYIENKVKKLLNGTT